MTAWFRTTIKDPTSGRPSTAQSYTHLQDKCDVSLAICGSGAWFKIVILKVFSSLSQCMLQTGRDDDPRPGKLPMHVQERILSGSRF